MVDKVVKLIKLLFLLLLSLSLVACCSFDRCRSQCLCFRTLMDQQPDRSCCPIPPIQVKCCSSVCETIERLESYGIQAIVVGDAVRIIIPTDVYIKREDNQVDPTYAQVFSLIVCLLNMYPGCVIEVAGHTDNVGSDCDKFKRSYVQARSVSAYLWSQGIALSDMHVVGYGDLDPVARNKTMRGSAVNRRVEILVNYCLPNIN